MSLKEKFKWSTGVLLFLAVFLFFDWCCEMGEEKTKFLEQKGIIKNAIKENERASIEPMVQEENQRIKVLLMTSGYQKYFHNRICLKAQGAYRVDGGDFEKLGEEDILELDAKDENLMEQPIRLEPINPENRLTLLSVERGQGNPSYLGTLTIYQRAEGFYLVNELDLEQYLRGVIPSEMPASYPKEALKAQAVCARTYASVQMQKNKLEEFHAQVDDSVSYQVYQNSAESPDTDRAVLETKGQVLLSEGKPINAYYFSTSHGKTSTDEVWMASVPSIYLKSVVCDYDAEEPWYSWEVFLSKDRLSSNAAAMFSDVKEVESVEIRETGEGDGVLCLVCHTDAGEKELHSEYKIRTLLAPSGLCITRKDGSVVKGGSLLPSAYFQMQEKRDEKDVLSGYEIQGGGYGHGVGMSQNGAKGMALAGKGYEEILTYFYKDVTLADLAEVVNP